MAISNLDTMALKCIVVIATPSGARLFMWDTFWFVPGKILLEEMIYGYIGCIGKFGVRNKLPGT